MKHRRLKETKAPLQKNNQLNNYIPQEKSHIARKKVCWLTRIEQLRVL